MLSSPAFHLIPWHCKNIAKLEKTWKQANECCFPGGSVISDTTEKRQCETREHPQLSKWVCSYTNEAKNRSCAHYLVTQTPYLNYWSSKQNDKVKISLNEISLCCSRINRVVSDLNNISLDQQSTETELWSNLSRCSRGQTESTNISNM